MKKIFLLILILLAFASPVLALDRSDIIIGMEVDGEIRWNEISGPYHDIRAYGGVCDNSTDITSQVNLAIAAANSDGRPIKFPTGWCVFGALDPITKNGLAIRGSGNNTVLKCNTSDACFTFGKRTDAGTYTPFKVVLEDFGILSGTNAPAAYFRFASARDCVINRVLFGGSAEVAVENVQGFGLELTSSRFNSFTGEIGVFQQYMSPTESILDDLSIATTDVDTGTDQITVADDTAANRITGRPVWIWSDGTPPAPLINGSMYYVIRVDATHIKLAYSKAQALASTAINLTSAGSTGATHSMDGFWAWSNDNLINAKFSMAAGTNKKGIVIEGGGGHAISNCRFENYGASGYPIYLDTANGAWLRGLTITNPYFEGNAGDALKVNDSASKTAIFSVHGGFHLDAIYNLGTYSTGNFYGADGYATGDITITGSAATATANVNGCSNYTITTVTSNVWP